MALGDASGSFAPTLRLSAAQSTSGSVTVYPGAKIQQDTTQQIVFGALTVLPGGTLTHTANSTARSFLLNVSVTGDFDLQAGATIAASGLGYTGGSGYTVPGNGPGGGTSNSGVGAGGAHGGAGGKSNANDAGGAAYDSATNPTDLGSGGGGSYPSGPGGAGGGAVLIAVGGTFSLNGQINANGSIGTVSGQNYGAGSGAGGAVNITAAVLNGAGQVLVNGAVGATGGNYGGGGGGGRIAVVVTGTDTSNLTLQARSGEGGGAGATSGGAGVIARKGPGASLYSLTIGEPSLTAQSITPIAGATPVFADVTVTNSIVNFDSGSTVTLGGLVVAGTATITAARLTPSTLEVTGGAVLQMSAQATGGSLQVDAGAIFRQMNALPLSFTSVSILTGGAITHAGNSTSRSSVVNLNVSGAFDLQAGAVIAADGLGYTGGNGYTLPGNGPGGGTSNSGVGAGGAHGGNGGKSNANDAGGAAYDSATNPTDLGSGGGGSYTNGIGGSGGGAVLISVGGAFSLNGRISANGSIGAVSGSNYGGGSGAGGAVNITAAVLNGAGQVLVNGAVGATGGNYGGGGGGGRIAVVVTGTDTSNLTLQARSGEGGGAGATSGGAGVIARKGPGASLYNLTIGEPSVTAQSITTIAGATPVFADVTVTNGILNFDTGSTATIGGLVINGTVTVTAARLTPSTLEVSNGSVLQLNAQATGGSLQVDAGAIFRQMNAVPLSFTSVSILTGGAITHAGNSTSRSSVVNLNVSGAFDLQTGAVIAANGLGYTGGNGYTLPGNGPGGGTSNSGVGAGGAHGGAGGKSNANDAGGSAYDNATNPTDLGSGGGGSYTTGIGGSGGGAVLISVGGAFSLNGRISANGSIGAVSGSNYGGGSGAGGAVNITAAALSGAGQVLVNGAAGATGSNYGGGGGGGRIAVVVTGTDTSNLTLQARSGEGGGSGATSGGAGVIARKGPGASYFSLTIGEPSVTAQSITPIVGATPVYADMTISNAVVNFDAGSTATIGGLVINGTVTVTAARLSPSTLEVSNGSVLQLNAQATGGSLQVDAGAIFRQMNAVPLSFTSVSILTGGALTHAGNSSARASIINLSVSGNFDLQSGAVIAVSGLGYGGGNGDVNGFGPGPGVANNVGGGGAHGGAGGHSNNGAAGGAPYDNAANPTDLGSGGAGSYTNGQGGAGGGAVLIAVGGAFSLNGKIKADGVPGVMSAQTYGSGGGAGGAVSVTATAFNGTGDISAKGGAGATGGNYGGGGGGGIVALTGCNSDIVVNGVNGGAAGGAGATAGGAGIFNPVVPGACPNAPHPPVNLAVSATGEDASGSTFVTATWDPAAQALSYVLEASTASNFTGIVFTATSTVTTATVRGLTPNATYFLEVKAFNDIGFSTYSAVVSTLTPADLTAPQAPTLLVASGRHAGSVALSWQAAVSGEVSAFYNVYRATESFASAAGLTPALTHLSTTNASDLPPADGVYFYGITALDPSGNESALSNRLSTASIHASNAPISDLAAVFVPAQKRVVLNWSSPSTGTAVSYAVYRATDAAPAAPQYLLQSLNSLTLNDQPSLASDATYFYRVTSLNPVGDESAASNIAPAVFDVHAPVISISGVTSGQHSRFDLTPLATITDFSAFTATITLNGQPFSTGTLVTAVGTYTFTVAAQDVFGATVSATTAFTIDKSSPAIALTFPVDGSLLNANATAIYTLFDDFTATGALVVRNGANQPPPFVFSTEGLNSVALTATDEAGNVGTATATFTLDKTAPTAVTDLHVGDVRVGEVDLLWTAPSDAISGVAGYLVRVATYPITAGNFLGVAASPVAPPQAAGTLETLTVLGDTTKTLYFAVRSTDAAGNLSAISNPAFVDTDPPVLTALSPALSATVSRPTRISLSASDLSGVASVVFTLDGVVVATRTSAPYYYDWATIPPTDGEHTLEIRATDTVGNSVVVPGFYTLHYAPPAAPTVTSPASGFSTFVATVTVAGTIEPGTTAQVRVNGVPAGTGYAPSGSFSVQAVLPVEGDYQLTVVATDAKGQSSPSASRTVYYNLAPPNPPADFSAETRSAGKIRLTWAVPGGKTPVSYRLYRSASAVALSSGVTPGSGLRVASGLTDLAYDDTPPSDGVYYYGATSLDSSGNESGLSEVASALSGRVAPTAAIAMTTSALAAGQYPLTLTLSKPLASVPILLFVANGAGPAAVSLSASSPTVWTGTLTVTAATPYGAAAFQFQGTDFAGNSGTAITSGGTKFVDNRGPIGAVTLYPFPPLKAGDADLALVLDEPAASTPTLAFVVSGGTYPVALEGAGTTWIATITIPSGVNGTAFFVYVATDALGNRGTTLSSGGSFATDTTAPGAPLSLSAVSRPAGVVRLSWSGPIGEPAAAYRVFRDSVALPGTVAPSGDQTGHYDDSTAEGVYTYETTSIDAARNESARSNVAAALSDATPPSAPANSTATISGGQAQISWSTVPGETYRVHRTTYATASLATAFVLASPTFPDTPPQNGPIYYAIEAVDAAGNVSTSASVVSVFFAGAPPVITITGVSDNGLYNSTVFPAFSASDPALDTASVAGRLNGAPFVSGSPVSAEGDYTLQATAKNVAAIGSTVTMHFTLDRSSPVISVTGVVAGQGYHEAVVPLVAVTDPRLAAVVLTLNGVAYTAGTPVSADGAYSLVVTARDLAGNVASSTVAFTLDLPPPAPPSFAVAIEEGLGASLSWLSPAGDTAGYRVYRDGVPMHQGLLNQALLSDPSFVLGSGRVYEVAAVDAAGQEGARATATIPAATVELESYGSVENGSSYLTRGFFDAVRVRLTNTSASSKLLGPTNITFLSNGVPSTSGAAPSVSVPAGAQLTSEGVLVTPLSLAASAAARVTVTLPAGPGASATLRRTFPVAARDPREPIVEVFAGALVRGTNASIQVKVNNQGSAPLQILSAVPSDLLVELRTPEGTVLSSARLSQSGNGAAPSPSGYFVAVPGGSGVLLDPVSVFVPDALGASAQLRARVDRVFSGLVSGGTQGPRAFETIKTMSGVGAPPYRATVRPEFALYDQNNSIRLLGEALDPQDALVPGATVQIGVSLRGFERAASTRTDETGHYQLTFTPTPNEAGGYTLWAGHPAVVDRAPQSSFTVVGLAFQYADYTATLTQNSAVPFRVSLTNTGQTRIDGLSASVISSTVLSGASLTLDPSSLPSSLDAGQSASLAFTASATGAAALGRSIFTARVTESHGFVRNLTVNADVAASQPVPSISPTGFNIGMSAGQSRTLEVRLSNSGTRDWQGVTVSAPTLAWVRVSGSSTLGDIAAGGSKSLFLVLEPPANLPSQAFAANPLVTLQSSNAATIPVNALITLTASGQGNVAYTVINADKPRNQFGAGEGIPTSEVTFVSLDVAGLSFHASADSNGVVRLLNVPAGRYSYTAKAAGFEDVTGVETIEPGVTLTKELLLPTNVVTYTWTVEPTTIQDKYDIQLGITFKTDVPAPVVSIDPAVMNFNLGDGESADAQMTVENKGLINATDVDITPEISDPAVIIDMPFHVIPVLHAGEKIVVPFRVGLVHASCHSAKVSAGYSYTCAAGTTLRKKAPAINMSLGSCFNLPTTTVGGGGGSGGFTSAPAGGSGGSGISLSVPASYVSFAIPNPPSPPAPPNSCRPPTEKYPPECTLCNQRAQNSEPSGDPRIPESDLIVTIPNFQGSLDFKRVYDSQDFDSTSLGRAWSHNFASRILSKRAGSIFFRDRDGDNVATVDYANEGGNTTRAELTTNGPLHVHADWLAELRTPGGRRVIFTFTGGATLSGPPGEASVLVLQGSTTAPMGYLWTQPDKTVYAYDASGKLASITDRNSNQVALTYTEGLLTQVRDPDNRTIYTLSYTGDKLTAVTDLIGRTVSFSYDGSGTLSQAVGPKGTVGYGYTNYTIPDLDAGHFANGIFSAYGNLRLLTSVTSPNGHLTAFTYGPPAKRVAYELMEQYLTATNKGGFATGNAGFGEVPIAAGKTTPTTSKSYYTPLIPSGTGYIVDAAGFAEWYFPQRFVTTSESGAQGSYSFEHVIDDLLEGGRTVVTNPRGDKETIYWENSKGRAKSGIIQDAAGGESKTTYDSNRYPALVTDRAGHSRSLVFDAGGRASHVTDFAGQSINLSYNTSVDKLASVSDARGNQTHFSYDGNGNLTGFGDALGHTSAVTYDQRGLPAALTDPLNHVVSVGRNTLGFATSITDPLNRTTQMAYDDIGRLTSYTDALNRNSAYQYDSDRNLTQLTDPLNGITRYEYLPGLNNSAKLMSRYIDPRNNATIYSYDLRSRLSSVKNALNETRSFDYNEANQLTKFTKADGTQISFEQDNLGRLTRTISPSNTISYVYDAAGNMVSAEDNNSKIQMTFDVLNRPARVLQTNKVASITSQIDYEYDANGNRTKVTLAASPTAMVWNYVYDGMNRLTSLSDPQNKSFSFEYDAMGRRTRQTYPNGIETVYAYDAASQLTSLLVRRIADQVVIASAAYTYDGVGNRLTRSDRSGHHSYQYDGLDRLIHSDHPDASPIAVKHESYGYDAAGNRLSDAVHGGYSYDAANHLTENAAFTYEYDQNGNLTRKNDKASGDHSEYEWDQFDMLKRVNLPGGSIVDYRYDAVGRLMERVLSSATTSNSRRVYSGDDVIAVLDVNNQMQAIVTHGPNVDEPLSVRTPGGEIYVHEDGLGSVFAFTDAAGQAAGHVEYEAFGRPYYVDTSTSVTLTVAAAALSFAGREFDPATSLMLNRARAVDVDTGRFISEDPLRLEGGANLYAYVENNPINNTDPYGLTFASNKKYFEDWWQGAGEKKRKYDDQSLEVKEMKESWSVWHMQRQFYKSGCKSITRFDYGTVQAYFETAYRYNKTDFEVGGYAGAYARNNGNGTVTYHIRNISGRHSFWLHLWFVHDKKEGPQRNIEQIFEWTEMLDECLCKDEGL